MQKMIVLMGLCGCLAALTGCGTTSGSTAAAVTPPPRLSKPPRFWRRFRRSPWTAAGEYILRLLLPVISADRKCIPRNRITKEILGCKPACVSSK